MKEPTMIGVDATRLPLLLKRLGITQKSVAKRAGLLPQEVSRALVAVEPGGTLERVVAAACELIAEAEAARQS
jgi:transcriptional regulator with XRE-family HTH domain